MNGIKLCIDHVQHDSKPEDQREKIMLSNRLGRQVQSITSRSDLVSHLTDIGTKGQAFCPATFTNGRRKGEYFEQTQMFVLDFDETIRMKDVYDRTEKYNLPILSAYETFSSEDYNRFRMSFLNDSPVTDIREAQAMQNALMTIFPEADKSCKSVVQMYFGGKEILYINEFIDTKEAIPMLNKESLFRNMTLCLKNKYGATNYKRKLSEFARENKIRLTEKGLLDISVEENFAEITGKDCVNKNLPNSSIISTGNGRTLLNRYYRINFEDNSTNPTNVFSRKQKSNYHKDYRESDIKGIRAGCKLFNEFESGSRRLIHSERFGLLTNLMQVESGETLFKRLLKANAYHDDCPEKYSDWKFYINYAKNYKPQSCDGYCPHKEECAHSANIISTCLSSYRQMERLSDYAENFVPIEEVEENFKRLFEDAFHSDKKLVYAIKAGCALGKTQTILEFFKNTSLRVLLAVPTIELRKEVCKRAAALGIEMTESPSLRELKDELPEDVWSYIEILYKSGRSPIPYLKKVKAKSDEHYAALITQYLKELEIFTNAEDHAITTHKRLETMDVSKYDLVIIDEDIIFNSIFRNKISVSVTELKKLLKKIAPDSAISRKIKRVLKCSKTDELFTLPRVDWDTEDDSIPMGFDMPSFASATHFICRKGSDGEDEDNQNDDYISFLKPVRFKRNIQNTKVIMVSATVDEKICRYYFGENRVEFRECKNAAYMGTLNQYYDRPYSRRDIKKNTSIIAAIKKRTGFLHTICFKKFRRLIPHYDGIHFGNTEGRDHLKGKNIDVIGTPHQPEWIYKLCAYSLGLSFDEEARLKPSTTVDHNGYRFRFMTYDDEVLRAFQFYIIESELEQAVGRARLLRCKCTVNLFSNFPLRQAVMKESEYGKNTKEKSV